MVRSTWAIWGSFLLVGCQSIVPKLLPPSFVETHPLLLEIHQAADLEAKRLTVLRLAPPGTSMEQAQATLTAQGFQFKPGTIWGCNFELATGTDSRRQLYERVSNIPSQSVVACKAAWIPSGAWRLFSQHVLVVLVGDDRQQLKDVAIAEGKAFLPQVQFFRERPDLTEPVGLTGDQARVHMEKFGFRCAARTEDGQAVLFCQAWNENPLGGEVIRVRLFLDPLGVVRECRVQEESEWFDNEACMLPRSDDSPALAGFKTAVFPVRLATRYALCAMFPLLIRRA